MNLTKEKTTRVESEGQSAGKSSSLPSCSRYSDFSNPQSGSCRYENGRSSFNVKTEINEQPSSSLNGTARYDRQRETLNVKVEENEQALGSSNAPTCSKYTPSTPTYSSDLFSVNSNSTRQDNDESSDDDYRDQRMVRSEVRKMRPDNKNGGTSGSKSLKSNERLRNLLIKKEDSSNMWYSYPCTYSSSSEN
ncbi:hypothetical protein JTB14_023291 [Gonioctena quinquepunctata]|nr:hypothetical protein JTB14_023291 [Gonioctena quinquepunctata]